MNSVTSRSIEKPRFCCKLIVLLYFKPTDNFILNSDEYYKVLSLGSPMHMIYHSTGA